MNRTLEEINADYIEFRGRCKELCDAAILEDNTLTLVRGHYYCSEFGEQPHWWTVRKDGTIYDPSAKQFPSNGNGLYVPFSGYIDCDQCGKILKEEDAQFASNYAFCSNKCYGRFVGVEYG